MKLTYRFLITSLLAGALAIGCGDDDRPGTDAGRDSGGAAVSTCVDLCALTEGATPVQGGCTSDYATDRGYNTDHPDCLLLADAFVAGTATAAMCNACYTSIGVSNTDCTGAHRACFMTRPPEDGGMMIMTDSGMVMLDSGMVMLDSGPPPADSGGGAVNTCVQLCALTPTTSPTQGGCVSDTVMELGYDTSNVPCGLLAAAFASGTATAADCNACYGALSVTDAHCRVAHTACY